MIFLGIESSGDIAGAALVEGGNIIGDIRVKAPKNHSVILAPLVADLFKYCNLTLNNIGGVGVNTGPGSFTGIRIGISLAASLAYGADLPLIKVSALEVLSFGVKSEAKEIISIIHGRKNEYYILYENKERVVLLEDFLKDLNIESSYLFVGEVSSDLEKALKERGLKYSFEEAGFLSGVKVGKIAANFFNNGASSSPLEIEANYLRKPEVDIKLESTKSIKDV